MKNNVIVIIALLIGFGGGWLAQDVRGRAMAADISQDLVGMCQELLQNNK